MENPVTDKELDAFYGVQPTPYERQQAINAATRNYDRDDLIDAVDFYQKYILAALGNNDLLEVGRLFQHARKSTIAARSSMDLYGKANIIKAGEIV